MIETASNDVPEVPDVVVQSVASWQRTIAQARPDVARDVLQNAAADLFRTRKINRDVYPASDGIVAQAIADGLYEMAEAAGIDADDAQLIFSQAQREKPADQANGHVTNPRRQPKTACGQVHHRMAR